VDVGFAKADGGVERGEAAETDGDGRHGSARPKRAIFELKDRDEIEGHNDSLQLSVISCQLPGSGEPGVGTREEGASALLSDLVALGAEPSCLEMVRA
jgi:hypothetical protein